MKKNGLLFGSFNPLHLSHIDLLRKGLEYFETLHVFIRNNPESDLVDPETKLGWLEKVSDMLDGRLRLYQMELEIRDKHYEKLDMTGLFLQAEKQTGTYVDGLICGEDMQYMVDVFRRDMPDREFIVIPRDSRSSTLVRSDLDKMKADLPDFVYRDLKERGY